MGRTLPASKNQSGIRPNLNSSQTQTRGRSRSILLQSFEPTSLSIWSPSGCVSWTRDRLPNSNSNSDSPLASQARWTGSRSDLGRCEHRPTRCTRMNSFRLVVVWRCCGWARGQWTSPVAAWQSRGPTSPSGSERTNERATQAPPTSSGTPRSRPTARGGGGIRWRCGGCAARSKYWSALSRSETHRIRQRCREARHWPTKTKGRMGNTQEDASHHDGEARARLLQADFKRAKKEIEAQEEAAVESFVH